MNREQKTQSQSGYARRNILLNSIMSILFFILLAQLFLFIVSVRDYQREYTADESVLISQLTYQEYDALVDNVYRNEARNVPVRGDMAEIYAAAHYYEEAMLYYAHQTAGNTAQAQKRLARMREYEEQMGEYAFVKEEIREFLEAGEGNF